MALTPEQLKAINDWYTAGAGNVSAPSPYQSPDGMTYQKDDQGIYAYNPSQTGAGQSYDRFGQDGASAGQGQFMDPNKIDLGSMIALGLIGGGAAGLFSGGAGGVFGIGGSGGAASGAAGGPGSAGWGMDLGGAGLSDTTYMGNIGGATGGGSFGGLSEMGLAGEGAFTGTNVAGGAATGSGIGGATALSAASKAPGWLAPAATLAGGLLGSQGEQKSIEETKKMDPRLDPYVFGANGQPGLLGHASQLLDQQMTPEGQRGFIDMKKVGQGLLSQSVAGNGVAQFQARRLW